VHILKQGERIPTSRKECGTPACRTALPYFHEKRNAHKRIAFPKERSSKKVAPTERGG